MHCDSNELSDTDELGDQGCGTDQNRRKEDRVPVIDSLYVIIKTQPQTMGQVVEISSTGLAFTFVDLDAVSQRLDAQHSLSLDLFAGGKGFYVKDVTCHIVSNMEETTAPPTASVSIKRVGVEFDAPSVSQQVQINQIIRRQHLKIH